MSEDKLAGCVTPGPALELEVDPGTASIMDCLAGAVGLARVSKDGDTRRVYIPRAGGEAWEEAE